MRLPGGLALVLALVLALAPMASAAEPPAAWTGGGADVVASQPGPIGLSVGPGRLVLEGPIAGGSADGQLIVRVKAPFGVRVTATLADVALGADGTPVRAPLGLTGWTLRNVATLTGNAFDYQPGLGQASFTVSVTARAPAFEQPRLGLVVVTAVPVAGSGASLGSSSAASASASVAGIVMTGPDAVSAAAVADAAPILQADPLGISRNPWTWLDASTGNPWPGLLDHGPATLTWHVQNKGDSAGLVSTTYQIWEIPLFGWLPWVHEEDRLVRAIARDERVMLPGQSMTDTLSSALVAATVVGASPPAGAAPLEPGAPLQPAWDLPALGIVRITVETTSVVAGLSAPVAGESVVLVIAPWKEGLAVLAGLIGLVTALVVLRLALRGARYQRRRRAPVVVELTLVRPRGSAAAAVVPPVPAVPAPAVPAPAVPAPDPAIDPTVPPAAAFARKLVQTLPPKSGTPTI